jgi:hypothetical protein
VVRTNSSSPRRARTSPLKRSIAVLGPSDESGESGESGELGELGKSCEPNAVTSSSKWLWLTMSEGMDEAS